VTSSSFVHQAHCCNACKLQFIVVMPCLWWQLHLSALSPWFCTKAFVHKQAALECAELFLHIHLSSHCTDVCHIASDLRSCMGPI
jgi:hypothetical protein